MLNAQLAELEQEFRKNWQGYRPNAYESYLEQVAPDEAVALLARLLSVELEYAYQPPGNFDHFGKVEEEIGDEDDDRAQPRVMLFLHRFPQLRQHRELLIQLVMLEFALRLRFDTKTPNYESYLDLCPLEKERLGGMMQVMEEKLYRLGNDASRSELSKDDTTVAEGGSEKKISLTQLPCSLGFFLLTDIIGQGGMGTVYSAVDLRSAAHVAVKIIHRTDAWSIFRFIEEFSWLSTLNHPNVVKLYDTFSEGDLRYFSMEVVEGQSIRKWFEKQSKEHRWGQLRRALSQAALAVAFLHDHDVIHRDIKSSNLMITGRGRAVLLDLGLASRAYEGQAIGQPLDGERVVGTLHYLSPEALHGGMPTFASDWYSFGVMMYETITGNFPPVKVDLQAAMGSSDRYYLDLATTEKHLVDCPIDLSTLCLEMLRSNASDRPLAADVIRRLGSDVGQPIPFSVNEADFVGREQGIEFLSQGKNAARAGSSVLRLIRGDSGLGKSTLLNRWSKEHLRDSTIFWLAVRCHSQDHTPLRALNLLVQELVTELSKRPFDFWMDLSRGGGEEIVYTFPQMARLPGAVWPEVTKTADSMEGVARRAAGLHALLEWLKGISKRANLVISIDDAQWADSESGRILSHLLRSKDNFRGLIILVDQGAEIASPFLQALTEGEASSSLSEATYSIPPLARDECQQLLDCWSGRLKISLRPDVSADILKRSCGSPFLLLELLRSYVNYIVRHRLSDDTWLSGTQKEAGVLHNRFSMLLPSTEKVLQFLAVAMQPLGIHQLQTASRILPGPLMAELNHLRGQGWIRWNGTALDSEVEISHERFREVVLHSMKDDRLQRRHYRLARMLSSEVPPPWGRIAHHYSQARQHREAAACYMEGARAAARRLAFGEALLLLEKAFHPMAERMAERTETENRTANRMRADCLAGHGNAIAAAEAYEALAELGGENAQLMRCLAGEQWIRSGRLERGLANLRDILGQGVLSEKLGLWQRFQQMVNLFLLKRTRPSMALFQQTDSGFSEIEQCLNRVSGPLCFLDGALGGKLVGQMFRLSLRRGTNFDRAIAIMRWSLVLTYSAASGKKSATIWIRLARELARASGSQNARALSHVSMFLLHSLQGRFSASLRYARRAVRLYEAQYASDTWETGFVCWISLAHLWYLGKLKELCAKTHTYRQDATGRTDAMWMYWMHVNGAHLADLIGDDIQAGRRSLDKAESVLTDNVFETPQILVWLSRVRQLLYEGDVVAAREKLLQKWQIIQSSSFIKIMYYEWFVRYFRVVCNLACYYSDSKRPAGLIDDSYQEIRGIEALQQPTFLVYASALKLVVDAAANQIAPSLQWQLTIEAARKNKLGLLVHAVQWHMSKWYPDQAQSSRDKFLSEGCIHPERLMNLILPLPHD